MVNRRRISKGGNSTLGHLPYHALDLANERNNIPKTRRKPSKSQSFMIRRVKRITLVLCSLSFLLVWIMKTNIKSENSPFVVWLDGAICCSWKRLEDWGVVDSPPPFAPDFLKDYPYLQSFEDNFETIQAEAKSMYSGSRDKIPTTGHMLGFKQSLYVDRWKSVGFKLGGEVVEENQVYAPETFELLRASPPEVINAFFSILEPDMHLHPHWGPWKGYRRYQLALLVPNNNSNNETYIRVSEIEKIRKMKIADREALLDSPSTPVHFYREGQSIMFDDSRLHDVFNNSRDKIRVVLFLDLLRKLPWILDKFNRCANFILCHFDGKMAAMRKRAAMT